MLLDPPSLEFAADVELAFGTLTLTASGPKAREPALSNILPEATFSPVTISECQDLFKRRASKWKVLMTEVQNDQTPHCPV